MTDVMGAMKSEHGKGPKMTSFQVVQKAMEGHLPPGTNINQFYGGLQKMLKTPNVKFLQVGNAVFMLKLLSPGNVEFHTFSAEGNIKNLIQDYIGLAKALKNQGIKHVTSYADSPEYGRIAEMTGLPVKTTQTQKMIGKQMRPVYQFDMDL